MSRARVAAFGLVILGGVAMPTAAALATSGPGCLRVVNVAENDALNLRGAPTPSARIVDRLDPQSHGIIRLAGPCRPSSLPWGRRWCPVEHYDGDKITKGWIKARFVRDSDCP